MSGRDEVSQFTPHSSFIILSQCVVGSPLFLHKRFNSYFEINVVYMGDATPANMAPKIIRMITGRVWLHGALTMFQSFVGMSAAGGNGQGSRHVWYLWG